MDGSNGSRQIKHPDEAPAIITIDGPAAAGKSTVARLLAKRLGFMFLDSGALYRGLALHLLNRNISSDALEVPSEALDSMELTIEPSVASMKVFLNSKDVTEAIRGETLGMAASRFSTLQEVRRALLSLQRSVGARWSLVAEGRDMGTVVFPRANVKFFLFAALEERSRRRFLELKERGEEPSFQDVLDEMRERDLRDETRAISPLRKAEDAISVDAGDKSAEVVVDLMVRAISEKHDVAGASRAGL